jgi:hypothetical protein
MNEERLPHEILNWIPIGKRKRDQKQDGKKAYSELWKNVICEMDNGRTDFIGDWVSNDYIRTSLHFVLIISSRVPNVAKQKHVRP